MAEIVIMVACCWGCGLLFYSIGIWASRKKSPMHFWAGTGIDAGSISDLPAYNHDNGVMWKTYSAPYWLAGILALLVPVHNGFAILSVAVIGLACFPGLLLLIRYYKTIEKKYKILYNA